ncbi:MAG: hypothetical protein ABIL05_00265 [candidate division WOR-3 bacterium]
MKQISIKSFLIAVLFLSLTSQCKWPWEYIPGGEDRPEAPAPPQPIEPLPETTIWYATPRASVTFRWTPVPSAESYELDIDTTSLFNSTRDNPFKILTEADSSPVVILMPPHIFEQRFYFRIRAVSSAWRNGSTDWSAPRWFRLRFQPGDKWHLLLP